MRDGEDALLFAGADDEIARLREVVRDRLIADDIETGVERRNGVRIMRVVGRHDRDCVDAVLARLLLVEQLAQIAVAACAVES